MKHSIQNGNIPNMYGNNGNLRNLTIIGYFTVITLKPLISGIIQENTNIPEYLQTLTFIPGNFRIFREYR